MDRRKLYPLVEVLFLTVSAVLSGFEDWDEIADFGEEKLDWLRKYLPYENGIPSHDTVNRVVSMIDYRSFELCFMDWANSNVEFPLGAVISLDGKKVRGSATKREQQLPHIEGGKSAVHLVHAWCNDLQMCLAQYKTEQKSNEITAIPVVLDLLEVEGCVITIDAMGCQRHIAEQIVDKGADYVLALKDNQEALSVGAYSAFSEHGKRADKWMARTVERGHGREEVRECRVLPADLLPEFSGREYWKGIKSIIEVRSDRRVNASGNKSSDTRYYISSLEAGPERFNELVRAHWGIENGLHWSLDVQFGEDSSRKRIRNAAQNFATIRKMVINLLKAHDEKISINRKRNKCAMSDHYREKILKI
jgi:predicted transposase YbfD/YdcC